MKTITLPCGPLSTNTYIVYDQQKAVVIDPADFNIVWKSLTDKKLELTGILLTHGHFDHILALPELRKQIPDVPIYIHPGDECLLYDAHANGSIAFIGACQLPETEKVNHYETLLSTAIGEITVVSVPGHSPGSVILECGNILFTGDFIFKGSIGRTDLASGSPKDMHESLIRFVDLYRDRANDFRIYPGHRETSTLAHELKTNPFLDRIIRFKGQ